MQTEAKPRLDTLYEAYAPAILRYLARITGSEEAAEDLTQETFLKALRHWGQLERAEGARAWLFRIATNAAYDHFRQRRRHPTTQLTELHLETLEAASTELQVEERELLRSLVARLPERYRLPLLLKGYAGYQVDDIAACLGWKVGTVKSRLFRARAQLQKQYSAS